MIDALAAALELDCDAAPSALAAFVGDSTTHRRDRDERRELLDAAFLETSDVELEDALATELATKFVVL